MRIDHQKQVEIFKDFFDANYKNEIHKAIQEGKDSLIVNFADLSQYDFELSEQLMDEPDDTVKSAEISLEQFDLLKKKRIRVRFYNLPTSQEIAIRNIRSVHLGKFIVLYGIVRQASDVRPQVTNAKFECPACGNIISILQIEQIFREPSRCSCGRRGRFKLVGKDLVDAQRLIIEESPEHLEGGEQPKRMSIFLKGDLVEPRMEKKTTPGSKVKIIGVVKEVPIQLKTGSQSTRYELMVDANYIESVEETYEEVVVDEEDEKKIIELSKDPRVYEKMINTIAPSIYGHEDVKSALVLQLMGGVRKERKDGTKTRGDLHILLVGDPGAGKSELLKFISTIAPKGRYISGKGATSAGLTASVVKDEFLRGWALEAGALVLANNGFAMLDELDKLGPEDTSAMHEALEQQCYHYDTIITFGDGSEHKIGELVEELLENNKKNIIQGKNCLILPTKELEVLTTDFKNIFKTKINRISKHKAFDKFIKIKFSNGRIITVTPEHPVFTSENGEIITKRADSIKIGDSVPIPLKMPIMGERQEFKTIIKNPRSIQHIKIPQRNCEEIFKIMGYFISEGSREINRKKLIGINFTNKDQRLLDDFESCMKKIFELKPYKQARIDNHDLRYMYRYTSRELAEFFNINFPEAMKTSGEKQIPQILMRGELKNISKMLSSMFEGDGHVSVKKRTIRIGYSTKSRRLAEQVQDLLLRFGIRSNLNEDREYFKVLITGYNNIKIFLENVGFITPEKNLIINKYLNEKTIKRTVKDIIPDNFNERIIKIIKEEDINQVKDYRTYDIIYDHSKRKDKIFSFSREFLINLLKLTKKHENIEFLESLTKDIGWEKVSGIEIIDNEDENWVYDITIEPNHAFVSQAAILHNTVTISKANIQATLLARTTVLAAANPKLGRFDPYQPIAAQIAMPSTLINRFDLIFPIRDLPTREKDDRIASHMLSIQKEPEVLKYEVPLALLKKYIAYARQRIQPKLTDSALKEIKDFYVNLRNMETLGEQTVKPIPITARQLEALVRLAEGSARVRLSKQVTKLDSKRAINILKHCLMAVGFDYETQTFDIDRISTGIPASQRSRIIVIREIIDQLVSKGLKSIPLEEIISEAAEKGVKEDQVEEVIDRLKKEGVIFEPRRGFFSKI